MQTLGHGIDLVDVARIRRLLDQHGERFVNKCFTPGEADYCRGGGRRDVERFAARFAAKEAALKALGTGRRGEIAWTDIAVVRDGLGKPTLHVTGAAAELAGRLGVMRWDVSLSHIETHATASVIATGLPPIGPGPDPAAFDLTVYRQLLSGRTYADPDAYLLALTAHCLAWCGRYNATPPNAVAEREVMLRQLFDRVGERPVVMPPFRCDFGRHISLGDRVYLNVGCVLLDCGRITIGDDVFLGPGVHVYTPHHPLDSAHRRTGDVTALPVTIESATWIGGHSTILPGVTIGQGSTVGAGSVVTKDVPPGVIAAGNPCRVLRPVGEDSGTTFTDEQRR